MLTLVTLRRGQRHKWSNFVSFLFSMARFKEVGTSQQTGLYYYSYVVSNFFGRDASKSITRLSSDPTAKVDKHPWTSLKSTAFYSTSLLVEAKHSFFYLLSFPSLCKRKFGHFFPVTTQK